MWVWRDDLGSGGTYGGAGGSGGWRLDAYGTWVWDEPSPLERFGAGPEALRRVSAGASRPSAGERTTGDRALAALRHGDPTPIFHELTVDRTHRGPRRETQRRGDRPTERSWRDRDALHVPEPHPGSGPLPVQDPEAGYRRRGLAEVPMVPALAAPEVGESPEDELRRRAERRRRPLAAVRDEDHEGGRHTWRREEVRTGRHALRR